MNNEHFNLTQSQLSLWTGQKLNPNVPLYNMAHSFDISGKLDVSIFLRAFSLLVKKVDILRTVFIEKDNIPFQYILDEYSYTMDVLDFTSKTENEIQDWLKSETKSKFDFSKPLFQSVLIKAGETRYIWFLKIHHLITDATTSTILYELQNDIYKSIVENNSEKIEAVPQFTEYLHFEKKQKSSVLAEQILEHWEKKTKQTIQEPQFYGIKNSQKHAHSHRKQVKLGADRSKKLRQLALDPTVRSWTQDLTLFNLITTTLFTFMHRISGQNNLSIGAPSHNRATKNFKKTPGLFIEVFPLFASLEEGETYSSILEKIKLETNEYLRYAQPGMALPNVSKSFNVVLNYINSKFSPFKGMPMQSEWIHPDHCDPAHALRCHVSDMDDTGSISFFFDMNTSVFNESLIDEVPQHFLTVLDGLIADINQAIFKPALVNSAIEILPEPTDNDNLILSTFEEQVRKNPMATALRFKNETYSFDALNNKANSLANYLSRKENLNKPRIALYLERSPEYIIGVLAILKLGGTFIPIASEQPEQRLSYITEDAKASLIFTSNRLNDKLKTVQISIVNLNEVLDETNNTDTNFTFIPTEKNDIAYILYTSGSTGKPKGVLISQGAISNYLKWASKTYSTDDKVKMPLFTSIGFDLTITATFLPLLNGGELIIYQEAEHGPDISLMEVLAQNQVNTIKLTPSHLKLIKGADMRHSIIKTMIVGGEDFKTQLAFDTSKSFDKTLRIFNEYGPTEATVGCIVSEYDQLLHTGSSVPIGVPIEHMDALILDTHLNRVPKGVPGELYLVGEGLATGYQNLPEQTTNKFLENSFSKGTKMYKSGDIARLNMKDEFEYLGRADEQVKLNGFRLELSDIEANLEKHKSITNVAVVLIDSQKAIPEGEVNNCTVCGLPSNYPNTDFDENGICHICNAFQGYKEEADKYFKTEEALRQILISKRVKSPNYDCISLLSGGKDSTYILAQLINMGLRVLAFTLDNGYISDQAKENINRIVTKLEVDHVYGTTEHMNAIFVDSLHRHKNVCDGCFKTIYTLSTQIALDKNIPFIVTGLSRGQFFETRLTEELFWEENVDITSIDETILEARKLYHQEEDAVKELLDVSMFNDESTFSKVQFVDFYRYSDVSLEEMLSFLKEKVDWVRPTDTGRSTNCLINQLGIYVHKKEKGYSNYSFPYSWDVRMGHKTRTETLEEINEVIDEKEVKRIMLEIGYQEAAESELERKKLVGYYTSKERIPSSELSKFLKKELPAYMVPNYFKHIEELPLTRNGKVDKTALRSLNTSQLDLDTPFVAPSGEIEELLANIWMEVLKLEKVGSKDNFIALGGHSLAAIRVTARIKEEIEMKFPLNKIFELPTIQEYGNYVEDTLIKLLEEE